MRHFSSAVAILIVLCRHANRNSRRGVLKLLDVVVFCAESILPERIYASATTHNSRFGIHYGLFFIAILITHNANSYTSRRITIKDNESVALRVFNSPFLWQLNLLSFHKIRRKKWSSRIMYVDMRVNVIQFSSACYGAFALFDSCCYIFLPIAK